MVLCYTEKIVEERTLEPNGGDGEGDLMSLNFTWTSLWDGTSLCVSEESSQKWRYSKKKDRVKIPPSDCSKTTAWRMWNLSRVKELGGALEVFLCDESVFVEDCFISPNNLFCLRCFFKIEMCVKSIINSRRSTLLIESQDYFEEA